MAETTQAQDNSVPEQDDFVFKYFDGEDTVYGDPQELHRGLLRITQGQLGKLLRDARLRGPDDAPGDSEEVLKQKAQARAEANANAFPAIESLLEVTRLVFKLKPLDRKTGKGATERVTHKVLTDFFRLLNQEKKTADS